MRQIELAKIGQASMNRRGKRFDVTLSSIQNRQLEEAQYRIKRTKNVTRQIQFRTIAELSKVDLATAMSRGRWVEDLQILALVMLMSEFQTT